ncbi:MAG: RNase adapter RapZ [Polyangiaceae bacterium]|nr:RNase adapter RapZ [Polyangiaceae bacterium]
MTTSTVVVVTGLSGAGKSTALHALEDLGFYCVDNLPTPVVAQAVEACERGGVQRLALGIDVRVGTFLDEVKATVDELGARGAREVVVLFLDASDEALLRRFSSTRRPHPLSTLSAPGAEAAAVAVLDGIHAERERLASLRARASLIVDTTALSVHELRARVVARFGPAGGRAPRMRVRLVSFGFKYGAPVDADMLLDVRFLQNPYFVPELTALPGTDARVRDYVLAQADTGELVEHAIGLLRFCLPRYEAEGKSYLTIGIGCTGGRHRSVALAEHFRALLAAPGGPHFDVVHRDVERSAGDGRPSEPGAARGS